MEVARVVRERERGVHAELSGGDTHTQRGGGEMRWRDGECVRERGMEREREGNFK